MKDIDQLRKSIKKALRYIKHQALEGKLHEIKKIKDCACKTFQVKAIFNQTMLVQVYTNLKRK